MVTTKRLVPASGQIILSTDSKDYSALDLKEGDLVEISVRKVKVGA